MAGKPISRDEAIRRFLAKVDRSGGPEACHPWGGAIKPGGYGHLNVQALGGDKDAHVLAYELVHGELEVDPETGRKPDIDHLCHNEDSSCVRGVKCLHRRCCNERHLEVKTRSGNLLAANEGHGSGRFAELCTANKHPMTGDNIGWVNRTDGGRFRYCRACLRERAYQRRRGVERPGPWDDRVAVPKDEQGRFIEVI
jgi:hypothetical protein